MLAQGRRQGSCFRSPGDPGGACSSHPHVSDGGSDTEVCRSLGGPTRSLDGAPAGPSLPAKLPSDLHQHLRQAIEKGDSECKQLAHEKGVQGVLGYLKPNRRNVALQVLAHPPSFVTQAQRVTRHPAKQGSKATWSSLRRASSTAGPSTCVCRGALLQGCSGILGKSTGRGVRGRSRRAWEAGCPTAQSRAAHTVGLSSKATPQACPEEQTPGCTPDLLPRGSLQGTGHRLPALTGR